MFADNFVHDQLDEQKIVFPPKGSSTEKVLDTYGVQAVDGGTRARGYAEEYIKVHLKEINDGKTYAETSNESRSKAADRPDRLLGVDLPVHRRGRAGPRSDEHASSPFAAPTDSERVR